MKDHWLTRKETAAKLRIHYGTLANWGAQGKGPPFVKLSEGRSGAVRYALSAVDAWLAERDKTSEVA